MRIATVLFAYRRGRHIKEVIAALENNTELPEKLFIFQDGYKLDMPDEEWLEVNKIIKEVNFCDCEVHVSHKNKGLAKAIYTGVSYALERYDAVIVLEDDCVPHPLFMSFMHKSLKKYEKMERVYSVCGNAVPYDIPSNGTDAYFSGRIDTWGWGTWKDRWDKMEVDYSILSRIKKNEDVNREFETWGRDFESYLLGDIYGDCDAWSPFWGMTVIENGGVCLSAYNSLIKCIGFDGSGTNCRDGYFEQRVRDFEDRGEIILPDEIVIMEETRQVYREYSAWTSKEKKFELYNKCLKNITDLYQSGRRVCDKLLERNIGKVAIWGKGAVTEVLIKDFDSRIQIEEIIESHPDQNKYCGINIVDYKHISDAVQMIIVIPSYDMDIITRKIKEQGEYFVMSIEDLVCL